MGPEVHMRGVEPDEERQSLLMLPSDEVLRSRHELVIAGLHSLSRERSGVLNPLLAHSAPSLVNCCVVFFGRPAMQHAARPEHLLEPRILRVVRVLRILFRIEVVEIAEELIEAM